MLQPRPPTAPCSAWRPRRSSRRPPRSSPSRRSTPRPWLRSGQLALEGGLSCPTTTKDLSSVSEPSRTRTTRLLRLRTATPPESASALCLLRQKGHGGGSDCEGRRSRGSSSSGHASRVARRRHERRRRRRHAAACGHSAQRRLRRGGRKSSDESQPSSDEGIIEEVNVAHPSTDFRVHHHPRKGGHRQRRTHNLRLFAFCTPSSRAFAHTVRSSSE